jgi:hypothetical protein
MKPGMSLMLGVHFKQRCRENSLISDVCDYYMDCTRLCMCGVPIALMSIVIMKKSNTRANKSENTLIPRVFLHLIDLENLQQMQHSSE